MKKVIMQLWEESHYKDGIYPDGCSIHLDESDRDKYVESVYRGRRKDFTPKSYDRIPCEPIEIEIADFLYEILIDRGLLRLKEYEMHNLVKMKDITC